MSGFFEALNYSSAHEDGRSELTALAGGGQERTVCITGSGARPLDLLLGDFAQIVAVDCNPAQNALLELKIAALRELEDGEFMAFIGVRPARNRLDFYRRVRGDLGEAARSYWDRHHSQLESGVIYCGRWERVLRLFAASFGRFRQRQRERLFACASVPEQAAYWQEHWEGPVWTGFLRCIFQRWFWVGIVREPGVRLIAKDVDVVGYIRGCFARAAGRVLFRDSPWAWLMFFGRYDPASALPLHLQSRHWGRLRARSARIEIVTDHLTAWLQRQPDRSIGSFSLSDVSSYATISDHLELWHQVLRTAEPAARVCERRFLVRYPTRAIEAAGLRRNRQLEAELEARDDSFCYDFIAGEIAASR
jgi:S-adenosylmethionine-diacylglycerol 3-amino-3-carboxypropyl transferase